MNLLILELTKYLICLLMLVYVAESFLVFRFPDGAHLRGVCIRQNIWMFAIQALLYTQIITATGDLHYLEYYLGQMILLLLVPVVFHRMFPDGYRPLVNHMCMLLCVGMVMILRVNEEKAVRQLIFTAVSFLIAFSVMAVLRRIKNLERFTYVYLGVGLFAIAAVLVLGSVTYGSKLSVSLFGIAFQPSEFVKILYIMFIAGMLYRDASFKSVAITAVLCAAHVLILVFSKDLGSALIFFVVFLSLVYIASGNPLYLGLGAVFGAAACFLAFRLFSHVQTRVAIWRDPFALADSSGYQITQSLFAISGGGWLGRGIFGGAPTTIPFVEEDLMFSAIAEELGLVFAILLVVICVSTFWTFLYEAMRMENGWRRLVACGIGVTYLFQVFLTIGGGTKFIPLTGVTLPLVSYGGSSVLSTILMFSVFEGICLQEQDEAKAAELLEDA